MKFRTQLLWRILMGVCLLEVPGMIFIAPYWNGGAMRDSINALALLCCGCALFFGIMAQAQPGRGFWTRVSRFTYAISAGLAFYVLAMWIFWMLQWPNFPVMNGTIADGNMGRNWWLGPTILVYSILSWMGYRHHLGKETPPARCVR